MPVSRVLTWAALPAAALSLGVGAALAAPAANNADLLRIRGGEVAVDGSHPYAALLEIRDGVRLIGHCSGALVGARWVATAAHCVTDIGRPGSPVWPGLRVSATIGTVTRQGDLPAASQASGSAAVVHPGFDLIGSGLGADFAMVRLDRPVRAAALPLFAPGDPTSLVPAGTPATTIGWGLEGPDGMGVSNQLREAALPILADTTCGEADPFDAFDGPSMVCAGFLPPTPDVAGTCQGDSGGPLIVTMPSGESRLLGIASWGFDSSCATGPDVFTEVPAVSAPVLAAAAADPVAPLAPPSMSARAISYRPDAANVMLSADAGELATRYTVDYTSPGAATRQLAGSLGAGGQTRKVVRLRALTGATTYDVRVTLTNALGSVSTNLAVTTR
ncbi:MAG: serine protease [Thermoleophilia bacterium]|nr:serine protease [Thermoleophilia bacterium]